jgi:[ribosomal protein S5]-alanine N-acetyltransferase
MMLKTTFGMLRPWQANDADALMRYGDNPKIWQNMRDGFPHPYTLENAQAFLKAAAGQDPVRFFAIANANEAMGGIGLTINQDVHRLTAELGYWLGEPFWGKGIMSEAVACLCEYGFEQLGLVRIYAEPYATNPASGRVLEKAGFVLEGRLRCNAIKEGQIIDQFMYAKVAA